MTDIEKQQLYEAIKKNVPNYFKKLKQQLKQKEEIISNCIDIANSSSDDYKNQINRMFSRISLNNTETILLNYICLIRHKEYIYNDSLQKDDEEVIKWVEIIKKYMNEGTVISLLKKHAFQIIAQYREKRTIGRPKGTGKKKFVYNNKEYCTIQQCAEDYNISKQGMHKRLKKLHII